MASGTMTLNNIFQNPYEITSNTSLNNYTNPGVYFCPNTATAGTLSEYPASTALGFAMFTLQVNTNNRFQVFVGGGNHMYIRLKTSNGWGSWIHMATE